MSAVKDKEETKIIWSKKEKDSSKETYGCEIVVENGKPSDVRTTYAPTDCFIVPPFLFPIPLVIMFMVPPTDGIAIFEAPNPL